MNHANDNAPVAGATGVAGGPRVLDLFSAAAGGWSLGMHRAGYRTIAACEVIDWRRALYSENNPGVPIYDDVTTLTADRLVRDGVGLPDIIVGSPPCQDISSANTKGKGVDGERSGLYFEAVRLIGECRPRWYALENSANLRTRGADKVIAALEELGYTCWPFVVSAGDVGANHERKRSWLIGFDGDTDCKPGAAWFRFAPNERTYDQSGGQLRPEPEPGRDGVFLREDADTSEAERRQDAHPGGDRDGQACERAEGADRYAEPAAVCTGNAANANEARQADGQVESRVRSAEEPDNGRGDVGGADVPDADSQGQFDSTVDAEMGGCTSLGGTLAEPWADWNSGPAHHLRVDDGLSAWASQSRIAVGGPRGTVAASLIVEAFGDAVVPQIPEAIGRAIWRVELALSAICDTTTHREAAHAA